MKPLKLILFLWWIMIGISANINIERILSKTFRRIFSRCVNYIYEDIDLVSIVDKSLSTSNIPIISIGQNVSSNLLKSECRHVIICLRHAADLEKLAPTQELLKIFKPWVQIVFVTNILTTITDFQRIAVYEKAIDVTAIHVEEIVEYCKFQNITIGYNITVNNLHRNLTLLTVSGNSYHEANRSFVSSIQLPNFSTPITLALFYCPPYVFVENNTFEGIEMIVIRETLKNFPVKFMVPDDNREDGGLWKVTADLVSNGERDITICSRWPINAINRNIDITKSIQQVCVTFLVKKPSLFPDVLFLCQAFNLVILIPSLSLVFLYSIFLVSSEKLYSSLENKSNVDYSKPIMDIMRILTGGGIIPSKMYQFVTTKSVILFWLLGCLLFGTYYSAAITSILTKPPITNIVNTFQDMVTYKIPWKLTTNEFQQDFYSMDNPVFKNLAKLYVRGRRILDRTENSAIFIKTIGHIFVNDIDELPERDRKYYKVLSECIGQYESVFFIKKDSPLTKLFDKTITRLVESGIANHLFKKIIEKLVGLGGHENFFSNYVDNRVYTNIDMSKLEGAFMLLGFGSLGSLVVLILEIVAYKFRRI